MDHAAIIRDTLDHIERRLTTPLRLDELADRAAFSPYHYHRLFQALLGEPIMEYIRKRRLTRAAQDLLRQADRPILQIALDYQFGSQEAFTRAFRKGYGVTPGAYRRRGVTRSLREPAGTLFPARPRRNPLFERINAVFVPVVDLPAAVRWYQEHLGFVLMHDWGEGADLAIPDDRTILTMIKVAAVQGTQFIDFRTTQGDALRTRLTASGAAVSEITVIDDATVFHFTAPCGNQFGVWQYGQGSDVRPVLDRIDSVFVPVRDIDRAVAWYQRTLGMALLHRWGQGADLQVGTGGSLLTLVEDTTMPPRGSLDGKGAPYFNFRSLAIERTRAELSARGVAVTEIVDLGVVQCFDFPDPDGNVLSVCYEAPSSPFYNR